MALLLWIEYWLYLAGVEDQGDGTKDSVLGEDAMSAYWVVDIDESRTLSNEIMDETFFTTPRALSTSPWICMVC